MASSRSVLLLLALGLAGVAVAVAEKEPDVHDLVISVKYKPEGCDEDRKAKKGDTVYVHYTGKLTDGTKFDSSRDRNQPFKFTLGAGQVIKGWDMGVEGACVGEKRKLKIPPQYGYGDGGAGGVIPPKATLIFDIEVMRVVPYKG
mmetsp:Transcript_12284/g.26503  ORF Transcript_12284/g.26503 Transcript_12284/m.26503 type:complete len:145 (+) Transcript_12284:84-518(+)|eukprot:CAMPEP_0202904568 /NCGR_PEP_ID=MMETSP1392-20130828/30041_1 /ASSEMBLY_ACC=CAM_ASM_000868 /TAXON_ID=225041 /ORGANISM="Chlamydomonas chlamydogama, Strain SAG 11-48b" /LENGTH=144 /DNA_ID=CAMNT_0049592247 /DNA_START=73 /DNA_END=507 /DNA_ORIENTATION=+